MCPQFHGGNTSATLGYTMPVLHKGERWYVDFYALDPASNDMRRKRYYIGAGTPFEKKLKAAELIAVVTRQLVQGWNPWVTAEDKRSYYKIEDCFDRYLQHVDRMDRKKTRQSYGSKINILREFIGKMPSPITYVYQFDVAFCTDFLDWIFLDRESCPRTRNNYRGWLFGFAEFLVARKYIKENPVQHIKPIRENEKFRKDLSPEMLKRMADHLFKTDKSFYLACLMQYYTLIRPGELSNLKIQDISLIRQTIFVSHAFSKNKKDAEVGLNQTIIKLMLDLNIFSYPGTHYIFGDNFKPNSKKETSDQFNRRWKLMRKELGWADCYQFYSLKDSGIRDLANSEGVVVAREQARHSDITTTNKYIQKHGVQRETLNFHGHLIHEEGKNEEE